MVFRPASITAFLAPMCLATAAGALDLEYVSQLPLHFPEIGLTEPSGLAVAPDGSGIWIVSDESRAVFKLDADREISAFLVQDDRMRDLEGVAADASQERLLMVSERTSSIVVVSLGSPHSVDAVDVSAMATSGELGGALEDPDDGLEGIALEPETGAIFILKERNPRLLIEVASSLDRIVSTRNLDSVLPDDEDVSGLTVDPLRNGLWIVSDVGKSVHFLPDQETTAVTFELFWRDGERKHPLDNAEGVALSPDGNSLFVVSDDGRNSRFIEYEIVD